MKPGLAVLPLEVWTDVFVYPWITREQLAHIVDQFKNRNFAEKLQFRLHDMGKHSLHNLQISAKSLNKPNPPKWQFWKERLPQHRASLGVAHGYQLLGGVRYRLDYMDRKFPETKMPENIKAFKQIEIGHLDDQVLDFLAMIRPLLTNVVLNIEMAGPPKNLRILFAHLLPMVGSIRGIHCSQYYMRLLERHMPGTMARAKELDLGALHDPDGQVFPTYLRWLSAPLDFDLNGPRFLKMTTRRIVINAIVDTVRKNFLAAISPSTAFVILIEGYRAEEFQLENVVTKERLTVRNGQFKKPDEDNIFNYVEGKIVHYVEIQRHPADAGAKMRDWIEQRAYFEQKYGDNEEDDDEKQVISIDVWPELTIGKITKKAGALGQAEYKRDGNSSAGPSAEETCVIS